MEDFPTRKITIYHKNGSTWSRYVKEASYRDTSIINRSKNGKDSTDNVLVRIFDIDEYKSKWFVDKDDVIVNKEVKDTIEEGTPITQLSKKYGKDNVHKINSVDVFIFNDNDIEELNHIKIGAI